LELIEVVVEKVQFPEVGEESPVLYLKERDGDRELPIVIGVGEAQSITMALQNFKTPRPLTHDLIRDLFDALSLKLLRVVINDLKENTYFARLVLYEEERKILYSVDARPSDSVAIALRMKAPIFVSEYVLRKALYLGENQ
jgi:hypothetical protein